jgi:TrmH family RNA methyltransferase
MEVITSAQNSKIKLVRALMGRPKERREAGAFVGEGVRLVEEAGRAKWPIRFALFDGTLSERGKSQVENLKSQGVDVEEVTPELMKSISDTESSQGILAVLDLSPIPYHASPTFILIPDQVRDPGNLGTLIRSADAAGVDAVLIPPETTDPFAPKAVRAGMGAHFRVPIHLMDWEEIKRVSESANQRVMLAEMDGESCWDMDLRQPLALIVGSEAEGASDSAKKIASQRIKIPMAGQTESLNAAVAGSVLLFEIMRQRSVIGHQ